MYEMSTWKFVEVLWNLSHTLPADSAEEFQFRRQTRDILLTLVTHKRVPGYDIQLGQSYIAV